MTPQPAKRYANPFQRFGAYMADQMVLLLALILVQAIFGGEAQDNSSLPYVNLVLSTLYFTYFHARDGATPGKKLLEIRVLSITGNTPTLLQAFLRYAPYSVFVAISSQLVIDPSATQIPPATQLFVVLFMGWHAACLFMLFSRADRRALHDIIAYTEVIYEPQRGATRL